MKHLTRAFLDSQAALLDPDSIAALDERPRTWGDCREATGPCPWVGCRYNLYLDVNPDTGSIKLNFPDLEPGQLEQSCALRLAARGPLVLENIHRLLNVTRERVRQIEISALMQVRRGTEPS